MDQNEALSKLAGEMEDMAKHLVDEAGGYPPFGGTMNAAGQVQLTFDEGAVVGGDYQRSLERLLSMLRSEAASKTTHAVGAASMGRVKDSSGALSTAIVISMHHRQGRCIDFVVPFKRAAAGEVTYDEPQAGIGNLKFF